MKDMLHRELRICMGSDLVKEMRMNIYKEETCGQRSEQFRELNGGWGKWFRLRET